DDNPGGTVRLDPPDRKTDGGCPPSPIHIYFPLFGGNEVCRAERLTGGTAGEAMRFHLNDRIDAAEPGKSLRAAKFLALGEEYLADHFPRFPVMPGVLMLQAVVEAAAWLWRATTDYRHPVIVLREVRNVKYGTFMQPGRRMDVAVELTRAAGDTATFKGKG